MLLTTPLCERQRLTLVCCQDWCFMEQGEALRGAGAGLAGGADNLRDASALHTEHGDATKLGGGRDELGEIIGHIPLLAIPLLVLDFQKSKMMQSGCKCWTIGHLLLQVTALD